MADNELNRWMSYLRRARANGEGFSDDDTRQVFRQWLAEGRP